MKNEQMQIKWFMPVPKNPLAIAITNLGYLSLNDKLVQQLPEHIMFGVGEDASLLFISPCEQGFRVTKSGRISAQELIACLVERGLALPARFTVAWEDDMWVGKAGAYTLPKLNVDKLPGKAKARQAKCVMEELKLQ